VWCECKGLPCYLLQHHCLGCHQPSILHHPATRLATSIEVFVLCELCPPLSYVKSKQMQCSSLPPQTNHCHCSLSLQPTTSLYHNFILRVSPQNLIMHEQPFFLHTLSTHNTTQKAARIFIFGSTKHPLSFHHHCPSNDSIGQHLSHHRLKTSHYQDSNQQPQRKQYHSHLHT
jgi:hypothetical protein